MSTTDPRAGAGDGDPETLPRVALEWHCDDPDDCEEVTVFDPDAADPTTHWLTVDEATAVPLEEAR